MSNFSDNMQQIYSSTSFFGETKKEPSLSEQRKKEAEDRRWGLESNPAFSEEKFDGINAKIEGLSYYNPDECIKHAMQDYENQAAEAIKSVKVKREGAGQFMCTEKDLADIRAQYPEGKRMITPNGPVKMYRIRKIKKWCDAICAFDVHISELGSFSSKRTVYTLDNVSVFFYHKNSDGIGQEIILKNKFFRKRKLAGKSKDL